MSRKIQIGFLIIFLFTGSTYPSVRTLEVNGPQIHFISLEHDFGEVLQGKVVKNSFKFVNSGDSVLVLRKVLSSCGCAVASWPKEGIMPGDTNQIKVQFNSVGKYGTFVKTFPVYSNASPDVVYLTIRGKVVLPAIEQKDSNLLISPVRHD